MSKLTRWFWTWRLWRSLESAKAADIRLELARQAAARRTAPAIIRSPEHKTLLLALEESERCWAKWQRLADKLSTLPRGEKLDETA